MNQDPHSRVFTHSSPLYSSNSSLEDHSLSVLHDDPNIGNIPVHSFDNINSNFKDMVSKKFITPPNSTIKKSNVVSRKEFLVRPLSPDFSSPTVNKSNNNNNEQPKVKRLKPDSGIGSRSNGNLTLEELLLSLEKRSQKPDDDTKKPPYSYALLIGLSIFHSAYGKLTLSQIYGWISKHFSFYKINDSGWQNSIRHNLSLNEAFIKAEKSSDGKGHFWKVKPGSEARFFKNETRDIDTIRHILKNLDDYFTNIVLSDSEDNRSDSQNSNSRSPSPRGATSLPIPISNHSSPNVAIAMLHTHSTPSSRVHSSSARASPIGFNKSHENLHKLPSEEHLPSLNKLPTFHISDAKLPPLKNINGSQVALFESPMKAALPVNSPSHANVKKYTSSFNSSFEETSPIFSKKLSTSNDSAFDQFKLPSLPSNDIIKTPKIPSQFHPSQLTPNKFITSPEADSAISHRFNFASPSNIIDDIYSPMFKRISSPIRNITSTPNHSYNTNIENMSPNTLLPPIPQGPVNRTNSVHSNQNPSSLLSVPHSKNGKYSVGGGLFGVDVYSIWQRAKANSDRDSVIDSSLNLPSQIPKLGTPSSVTNTSSPTKDVSPSFGEK